MKLNTASVRREMAALESHGHTLYEQIQTLRTAFNGSYAEKQANGVPLLAPWIEAMSRKVFGYDVILSDEMPRASAPATAFIAFEDQKFLLYGDRLEIKFFGDTVQRMHVRSLRSSLC